MTCRLFLLAIDCCVWPALQVSLDFCKIVSVSRHCRIHLSFVTVELTANLACFSPKLSIK